MAKQQGTLKILMSNFSEKCLLSDLYTLQNQCIVYWYLQRIVWLALGFVLCDSVHVVKEGMKNNTETIAFFLNGNTSNKPELFAL